MSNTLIQVSPRECIDWSNRDRGQYDLEADNMAEDLLTNGQEQPIIIRPCKNDDQLIKGIKYEVIDGTRRLAGADILYKENSDFRLNAVLRELDNCQAQMTQLLSHKRNNLCGYDWAKSLKKTMDVFEIDQNDLAEKIKVDKSTISKALVFLKIPNSFWDKIFDKRVVSRNLALRISVVLNKAKKQNQKTYDNYLIKITEMAPQLEMNRDESSFMNELEKMEEQLKKKKSKNKPYVIRRQGKDYFKMSNSGEIMINKKVVSNILNKHSLEEFNEQLLRFLEDFTEEKQTQEIQSIA